ncbi:hypothetical protein DR095_00325 [Mycoplasma flocculare]|uniref:hypothetical protein n=1 Tax=Mesomycoplasma flocculare TaxID=2128 RepID=UPI001368AD2A|nr:hypothetical protein [Mesomycoplasma flocculare]MXR55854.1 hypothetical protein [Mesomycoplasma flocculare]
MFSLIRKITKKIFKKTGKIPNFSFCLSQEKKQIQFFNEIFIEKLDFRLVLLNDENQKLENKKYEIINLDFKYSKHKNQHFLPFEVQHKFCKIKGSIIISLKKDQIIIEKRINANKTIKSAIKTKIILSNQAIKKVKANQISTNFKSYSINYFSTYQNWVLKNEKELIDLLEMQDNKNYLKNWKTGNNNKNYHTIKIKIGLKNEKI